MIDEKIVEAVARAIYATPVFQPAYGPWQEGSNRAAQQHAGVGARAAITAFQAEAGDTWLEDERTHALYQVIGHLSDAAGVFEDPAVTRALDLAAYGKTEDGKDVLPFAPNYPAPKATP